MGAGLPTSFRRANARKNTLNMKNRVSLANKATVSVSPKILQFSRSLKSNVPAK